MLKVVIVEDEEIIRNGLTFFIDWIGCNCIIAGTAGDGEEGLALILKELPDIVITDIRMPKLSGIDMLEQALRKVKFHSIILTSYAEFEYAKKAVKLGASDYLLKPVDQEEMLEVIKKIAQEITDNNRYQAMEKLVQEGLTSPEETWKIFEQAEENLDYYVKRTYEIIKEKYREKLSINDVAEALGVSASYVSRRLKSNLNTTFVDLLNQYRIREAIGLLKQKNMKIYEVSDFLGFSDYKQFSSVFKKYMQVSPSEYIR